MRLSLATWLERTYDAGCRPTLNTARAWARAGKLDPPAVKEGRSYYVAPDTRYNANPIPERPTSLLDRVRAAEAKRRKEPRPPA